MSTYITIEEADVYFNTRLWSDAWLNASLSDKIKALTMATQIINNLKFQGMKVSPNQDLEFPRDIHTQIPDNVKYACAEIAYTLLQGVDIEKEIAKLRVVADRLPSVSVTYDTTIIPENLLAGIPSYRAWVLLKPYLVDMAEIEVSRV